MNERPKEGAALHAERLLQYALRKRLLDPFDAVEARNALLDALAIDEPYAGPLPSCDSTDKGIEELLEPLVNDAAARGLLQGDTLAYRDLFDARLMGVLIPKPSTVAAQFRRIAETEGIERATEEYYRFSVDTNYIRMGRVKRNEYWRTSTEYGELEITVNLTKPEKDPKEIAAERAAPQVDYPKCLLCVENVGYAGRVNHPARQNHRVIPIELDGQPWFLQYSPYVYYNEHCIVFSAEHMPMRIADGTFRRLLDFVGQFPHYFLGSNADLPIVGGSILSHDHFQGGRHTFPMEKAPIESAFRHPNEPSVKAGIVRWPMSAIRLSAREPEPLARLAAKLLADWRIYSDPAAGVYAYSEDGAERVPHNTITPIARLNAAGQFELDLVLRNNRRSAEHPDGIFHPHAELHHIKKENIGLIEVMGLAVLPGRLKQELEQIEKILSGTSPVPERMDPADPLAKHAEWLMKLIAENGTAMSREKANERLRQEIGNIFKRVLEHAGVFRRDEAGRQAFRIFMANSGFVPIV